MGAWVLGGRRSGRGHAIQEHENVCAVHFGETCLWLKPELSTTPPHPPLPIKRLTQASGQEGTAASDHLRRVETWRTSGQRQAGISSCEAQSGSITTGPSTCTHTTGERGYLSVCPCVCVCSLSWFHLPLKEFISLWCIHSFMSFLFSYTFIDALKRAAECKCVYSFK